jgi:hypothetical protein
MAKRRAKFAAQIKTRRRGSLSGALVTLGF